MIFLKQGEAMKEGDRVRNKRDGREGIIVDGPQNGWVIVQFWADRAGLTESVEVEQVEVMNAEVS